MNDARFEREVAARLTAGLARLDPEIATRLQMARKAALAHAARSAADRQLIVQTAGVGAGDSGGAGSGWREWLSGPRLWLAGGVLAIALAGAGWSEWSSYRDAVDSADLDLAILADDLPPTAYIDNGFDAWLKRPVDPQQPQPQQ